MRKITSLVLLILINIAGFGQSRVELISSESLTGYGIGGVQNVVRPVFNHDGSTLSADSANYNPSLNIFDAFGHVVITQPNGTVIYSDLLNYNGNNHVALLTNNVRMIDKDATLTTNYFTYNTATKIGTYTNGGKIVNAKNVITSKNGYYFESSRDAYFRYDAVVTSPDVVIKSDTLRYNSGSKIAYFYGPTTIYGKDDTLYTENGTYNTITDQARFGKKNLYTQGTKSLKGDSLFYDKKAGFGKAIKNITFVDTEQKIVLKGDLGIYHKADESTLVTKNAYVIMSSESDSGKVDSIWMTADTLYSKVVLKNAIKLISSSEVKKDTEVSDDVETPDAPAEVKENEDIPKDGKVIVKPAIADSIGIKSGAFEQKMIHPNSPDTLMFKNIDSANVKNGNVASKAPIIERDSVVIDKPLVKPNIIPEPSAASQKKNVKKKKTKRKKKIKVSNKDQPVKADSVIKEKVDTVVEIPLTEEELLKVKTDSLAKVQSNSIAKALIDSIAADTTKTRIILAFHHAKVFKSDLQAKADSMFFSYADSTLRCYYSPMIWTQGSQLSADTVYLQMKNKKLDNMLLRHNGFVVNTEDDSIRFNQIRGKIMTGFFKDGKMNRLFVDGNAESIYYAKEDSGYTGMNKSVSSRMKVLFNDNKLSDVLFIRKPEMVYYPIEGLPADTVLKGFIWKPKDRPKSKEEIIPSLKKMEVKPAEAKKIPKKNVADKELPITPKKQKNKKLVLKSSS